jgi:hypothetical protein
MKKLLARFMVSAALDRGAPLSPFWRRRLTGSRSLQEFEQSARDLDQLLREPARPEPGDLPASLHESIMGAVRKSATAPQEERPAAVFWATAPQEERPAAVFWGPSPWLRWGAATALVLLAALGVWRTVLRQPPNSLAPATEPHLAAAPPSLPGMGLLLDQVAADGAAFLSRPLERPMEEFSRDMRETAQFLMASLP